MSTVSLVSAKEEITCLCGKYRWALANPGNAKLSTYHCDTSTTNQVTKNHPHQKVRKTFCSLAPQRAAMGLAKLVATASRISKETRLT